jgi:hypothetical protein
MALLVRKPPFIIAPISHRRILDRMIYFILNHGSAEPRARGAYSIPLIGSCKTYGICITDWGCYERVSLFERD